MRKLLLIMGDLATGKSTFAGQLSRRYGTNVFYKDTIKEVLGDTIGFRDREENLKLSRATGELMAFLFGELGMGPQRDFAAAVADRLRGAIREHLLDYGTMTAIGNCQTSQAMAIHYGIFEPGERPAAFQKLLQFIRESGDKMDVGVLGARVLFHVLAESGHTELALKLIRGPEFPSYGYWLECGATSLWENFFPGDVADSRNHHFWGDISHFFIRQLAGIRLDPTGRDVNRLDIVPRFPESLSHAEGWYRAPAGEVRSAWVREGEIIRLTLEIPQGMKGRILPEPGYSFTDGFHTKPLASGTWLLKKL